MIFDTLNNLPNYLGISRNLDTAIEYIMARDIATLPEGRTRVDGDAVVAEVRTLTPQSGEKVDFACREGRLTLLTDLAGSEMFEVSLGDFAVKKPAGGGRARLWQRAHQRRRDAVRGAVRPVSGWRALQDGHQGPGLRQSQTGGLPHCPGRGRGRPRNGSLNKHPSCKMEGMSL